MPRTACILLAFASTFVLTTAIAAESKTGASDTIAVTRPDPCAEPKRDGKKATDKKSTAPAAKTGESAKPR